MKRRIPVAWRRRTRSVMKTVDPKPAYISINRYRHTVNANAASTEKDQEKTQIVGTARAGHRSIFISN